LRRARGSTSTTEEKEGRRHFGGKRGEEKTNPEDIQVYMERARGGKRLEEPRRSGNRRFVRECACGKRGILLDHPTGRKKRTEPILRKGGGSRLKGDLREKHPRSAKSRNGPRARKGCKKMGGGTGEGKNNRVARTARSHQLRGRTKLKKGEKEGKDPEA